jgi:hypothetical protein
MKLAKPQRLSGLLNGENNYRAYAGEGTAIYRMSNA